jgi:hypothetical protein
VLISYFISQSHTVSATYLYTRFLLSVSDEFSPLTRYLNSWPVSQSVIQPTQTVG